MDLVDKFDFALTSLRSGSSEKFKEEEMVFYSSYISESSPGKAIGYSVADPIFKDIADALESHFQRICAPMAKKVEFNMVNHFSNGTQYKEVYEHVLNHLKRIIGNFLSTYKNKGEVVINLTSDQIEITFRDLILRPLEDEMAIYYKLKNNRFYNVQVSSSRNGKTKYYEVCLTECWGIKNNKEKVVTKSIKHDKRKNQWERGL